MKEMKKNGEKWRCRRKRIHCKNETRQNEIEGRK
jgi:hypothetical protein